ncbi:MAG: sigma-70 family RNA polymerase sigma factor [Bryobacteraceae bacterium]|jgi:RNA polymerase sigma-70 factor (ECF subfamily)
MKHAERERLFVELFEENKARVLRLCYGYLNSEQEAEDLFQEVMKNVWNSLDGFRREAKISTWLFRIAVNTALMYRRKLRRGQALVTSGVVPDTAAPAPAPDDEERLRALRSAIAALPAPDRLIVTLLLEGLSYKEIADVTGITVNYVGVKISRIKEALEKLMRGVSHGTA